MKRSGDVLTMKGFTEMSSPMMIQVDLVSGTNEQMTTWIEKDAGANVYLPKPKKWYTVIKMYDIEIPKDQLGVRGFKNNI